MVADRIIEFGFLWSLFWSPWGPVPRYLGWLLVFIGLALKAIKRESLPAVFDRSVSFVFIALLIWGGVVTWFAKNDFALWGRGYSMLVEFVFACWLAAYVLRKEKNVNRWVHVWYMTVIVTMAFSFFKIAQNPLGEGVFSNINSLGLYVCLIFPFALLYPGSANMVEKSHIKSFGYIAVSILVFIALIISFTTAAWMACVFSLFFLLYYSKRVRKITALFILIFICVALVGHVTADSTFKKVFHRFSKEVQQITSFHDISHLTTNRSDIWQVAYYMVKEKPITGWGWGRFREEFQEVKKRYVPENHIKEAPDAHNMYLNLLIYGGIPTLIGMLYLFGVALKKGFQRFKTGADKWRWLFLVCWVTILLILLYSIGGDVFSFRYKAAVLFWTVLGFSLQRENYGIES
ncbi:MAG: O-antigen ligase family protein [Aminobacterium colombiense]|jgi:O-antigen ligase|uniref:O-antigen ligase family protein n=1 Tax=Aminobacterium sp. EBM-42 TaxID=1918503 RepID=UPI001BD0C75D|nr:O-antigen ligase family protein [Aminobacterium sp. EBM-42]MDD2378468.1 O-antigen ligase family protein [Aminobacterium colombiense]MDD3768216.1 O-antigen ligase family protein [Aminobacterium colombiense]MDD4265013.1 O-antigen ligase family protein [Aminobacterium colombiense]MDD4586684.1 O-antigen ligase family protein [Aminobacterium colombiense]